MQRHPLILSLLYFAYAVFVARQQNWQAGDIVWSMWVSSLIGGYGFILLSIIASVAKTGEQSMVASIRRGAFLMLFFTLHFGGFHWVHGQIVQGFFPLADSDLDFWPMLQHCVDQYWPFVIVSVLNLAPQLLDIWKHPDAGGKPEFKRPYQAVLRNHLMIFLVAFANTVVETPTLLYLLLILYFFPFAELMNWRKSRAADQP